MTASNAGERMMAYVALVVFFAAMAGLAVVAVLIFSRSSDIFRAKNITEMDLFARGRMKLFGWWIALIIVAIVSGVLASLLKA